VSYFATFMSKKFVLKVLLYESCVYRIVPFKRLVNSNMRNALSLPNNKGTKGSMVWFFRFVFPLFIFVRKVGKTR
jgi:hypothetical protein